ncbi:hypothetical protein DPMN_193790 [Dreissena polymorpha]|uniref:Uncharacterized protein n=1 Tax=Dreissena polymorpha TaxID=45954 RepID=A0A9D3Y5H2_DREPO|nr:hypothetical protein DPMN_193790 [Dreissena polymorpha]
MSQAGNDYDTSAIPQRNEVIGDYNYITNPVRTQPLHEVTEQRILNKGTVML